MKNVSIQGAQGDVLFVRVAALPPGLTPMKREAGKLVVAHSETGHHHAVDDMTVAGFEVPGDPLVCYLQLGSGDCDVVHHRGWDTHEALRLLGGPGTVFKAHRQREFTPEGWRRVAD